MNSLKEYGDLFLKLNLSELSIREGNFSLVLKREVSAPGNNAIASASAAAQPVSDPEVGVAEQLTVPEGTPVKAPLLGIYSELSGDRNPVKEGDKVKKGDALCTIEAMKMLNEVVSPADGTVIKVCAKPGDLVEFNQELYIIKQED